MPKIVVAELKGCDPLLWRPEYPAWMRSLEPGRGAREVPSRGGNGQPPSDDDEESQSEPEPPPNLPEEN